jgi:hypothetical protein
MLDTDGSFARRRSEGISDYSVLHVEFKKNKAFVTLYLDPWKSSTLQSWMKVLLLLEGLYNAKRNGLKLMLVAWKFDGGSFNISKCINSTLACTDWRGLHGNSIMMDGNAIEILCASWLRIYSWSLHLINMIFCSGLIQISLFSHINLNLHQVLVFYTSKLASNNLFSCVEQSLEKRKVVQPFKKHKFMEPENLLLCSQ